MPGSGTIAVVLKGYPRLSETFIAQELLALEQAGFELALISLRHPTDKHRHPVHQAIQAPVTYLPEYLRDEPQRVVIAGLRQVLRPAFWRALSVFCRDYWRDRTINRIRRFGQALVLASELTPTSLWIYAHFIHTPGSVARYAAILRGLPFSLSAHAKDIWTIPDWEIREKLNDARWTVCCTQAYSERLRAVAPHSDVRLLYHGIDLARFAASTPRQNAKGPLHIVTIARAVEKKGLDSLLKALALLPPDVRWHFSHIGGGPLADELASLAASLGIQNQIIWHGSQPQDAVLELLRAGDLFCLPARLGSDGDRDGLPNAIMEALSQSLPVIATDVGGIGELIDETCGMLVPGDDPKALAMAIERLARDPSIRSQMGKAGRRKLEDKFAFDANVSRLITLFEQSLRP